MPEKICQQDFVVLVIYILLSGRTEQSVKRPEEDRGKGHGKDAGEHTDQHVLDNSRASTNTSQVANGAASQPAAAGHAGSQADKHIRTAIQQPEIQKGELVDKTLTSTSGDNKHQQSRVGKQHPEHNELGRSGQDGNHASGEQSQRSHNQSGKHDQSIAGSKRSLMSREGVGEKERTTSGAGDDESGLDTDTLKNRGSSKDVGPDSRELIEGREQKRAKVEDGVPLRDANVPSEEVELSEEGEVEG